MDLNRRQREINFRFKRSCDISYRYANRNTFFYIDKDIICVMRKELSYAEVLFGEVSFSPLLDLVCTQEWNGCQKARLWLPLIYFVVFIGVFLPAQLEALFVSFVLQLFQLS